MKQVTRMGIALAVLVALFIGTFWGDDDHFPFGPFRMYSTKQELNGEVRAIEVLGLTTTGRWVRLPFDDFGLRPADVEGQIGTLGEPPIEVLASMYEAYERIERGSEQLIGLKLLERTTDLEGGRPAGESVETLGIWRAP